MMRKKIFSLISVFLLILVALSSMVSVSSLKIIKDTNLSDGVLIGEGFGDGKTEYWALVIAANCDWGGWGPNISGYGEAFRDILLLSDHWDESHIKLLLEEQVSLIGVILGFSWLRWVADKDDVVLIYYLAHGGQLSKDLFPFDEEDGKDEYITTYYSSKIPFSIITDDFLKVLIKRLRSDHVGVIIGSCYSGGMGDFRNSFIKNNLNNNVKSDVFMDEFVNDFRGNNLIMLMACQEDELSTSLFDECLILGLQGYGDNNYDEMVSMEELFN